MFDDIFNKYKKKKEPDIFDKYKSKLDLEKAKDVEIGIGAKAEMGVTLPESEVPSYWGISDVTPDLIKEKVFQDPKMMELHKINFESTQLWLKELKESKDKWAFLRGEGHSPELKELRRQYNELAPHMYGKSEQWIQVTALAAIAVGLASELIPLVVKATPEMLRSILYKTEIKDIGKKELQTALYNVSRGTDTSGQRKIFDTFIRAKEIGVPFAERLRGVKIPTITPRFAFGGKLYAGLPADEIVKSIVKVGKVTAEMVKGLDSAKVAQVMQQLSNISPALASEFTKAVKKIETKLPAIIGISVEHPIHYYVKSGVINKFPDAKAFKENIEKARKVFVKDKELDDLSNYNIEEEFGSLENYYNWAKTNKAEIKSVEGQYNKFIDKLPVEDKLKKLWKKDPENLELNVEQMRAIAKPEKKPEEVITKPELITEKVEEPIEKVELPPKEPWEPLTLPPPAEVPKIEPEFKEPNVHKYYMPKDQLMREIGAEPLTRPLMLKKEEFMLKKPEVKKWVKDVFKEVKAKATFAEKLKAGIFNKPTEEVARFRDLLNTYKKSPDFLDPKTKVIFDKLRSFTKGMLNDANEMRVRAGLKPIADFGAYVPHFLDELARKIRLDEKTRNAMEGIVGKKLPKGGNPTALQRKIGVELDHIFSKDLEKLLMSMAEYDLRDIYLAEPYAILRAQLKELRGRIPETVLTELENYIAYDIFDKRTDLDNAINATLKPGTDIVNLFLKPFNRVITDPIRIASSMYRFGVMGGAIAGKVRMLTRNLLQRSLGMCIYGPQALIKGQFVAPKDVMEKIRNLDVYKLSVRKFEDVPATIPWIFKPIAKAIQAGLVPYARTHAGLTYVSNVDVLARTGFFYGERKTEWQKSEGAMEYTKAYAKKFGIKEGTPKYERLFWREGDDLLEAEEAIGSTQWFYFPTRMPRPYRGQAARAFWSLNSWWMTYWGKHFREMMSRCRGVTGRGRILTRWERLNAFKGLAIILGIGEAVRRKYKLRTSEFLAFVFPVYIYPHLYQIIINTYDALTATVQSERDKAQKKLKYNLKMLAPFSGAYREYVKFINGEITLKEYLFYVEKVSKGEISPPSDIFDKYGPTKTTEKDTFDKYGKETKGEDIFNKYKR